MQRAVYRAIISASLVAACLPMWAVGRTTPVEVMNTPMVGIDPNNSTVKAAQIDPWLVEVIGTPSFIISNSPTVKIDGTTNTVKATQSGTWNVGVSSMPTVNVNTHAVTQSGTWNVGISGTPNVSVTNTPNVNIANTPSVSVANSPTVKIDSTANAVDTPTRGYARLLFSSNQVIPNGSQVVSDAFNCSGYKEVRFAIHTNFSGAGIYASVEFQSPAGYWMSVHDETLHNSYTAFCVPVYNTSCRARIVNYVGGTATIYSHSWVYMVN